ncbi:death-on-curing family protein [Methylobacterium radiotolerans JCM 2831]|uniref:Death-on-curing family protein n=2 Tax=Methylobacterium radiotolerans TaxID=31998 RepID=B1M324_METRJ|nr:death-on-curing family protein [Methylobacterium radiotolerans JCM 2831]GEM96984.1 hypothetical protein MRA01_15240 [Methylobacterium radiotolerans]
MNSALYKTPAISPSLIDSYERDAKVLASYESPDVGELVEPMDVLRSHYVVVDFCLSEGIGEGVGGIGPRSFDLLISAVDRQFVSFGSQLKWSTPHEKISTLVYGLVKNHPFHDTNKRTALIVLLYAFYKFNTYVVAEKSEVEDALVYLAEDSLHLLDGYEDFENQEDAPIRFFAEYLRKNTRHIDKKQYLITYRELDRRLRSHGFAVVDPDRNYADIIDLKSGNRICKIGFPGWSRQMGKGDIRKVLDACELTPENGVDAQVFFFDADPVFAFASEYRAQISSLAYR